MMSQLASDRAHTNLCKNQGYFHAGSLTWMESHSEFSEAPDPSLLLIFLDCHYISIPLYFRD